MSETTFRAVVAAVLVAALALAIMVAAATLYRPAPPLPSPSIRISRSPTPVPSPSATPYSGPVLEAPDVVSVGLISRDSSSAATVVLKFLEIREDALRNGPGSFLVTLADRDVEASTITFVGTPTLVAPGSLGATVTLAAPNVLMISIVASDPLNVESMTISGLGISATATAAIGPVTAEGSGFTGSLATGWGSKDLPSPGSVVAVP